MSFSNTAVTPSEGNVLPEKSSTQVSGGVADNVVSLLTVQEPRHDALDIKDSIMGKVQNLPPLPKTIVDIYALKRSSHPDTDKLLEIIQTDPMIVANLLKISNSVMYGLSRKINTAADVLKILGYRMVINVAMCTSISGHLKPDLSPYGVDVESFTSNSALQGAIMENWKDPQFADIHADLQFAAFLQDVGIIVISKVAIEKNVVESFRKAQAEMTDRPLAEEAVFGLSAAQITGLVFSEWKFNQNIVEFISAADNPSLAQDPSSAIGAKALKIVKTLAPV
jgi:HD-like signal output (HDOD) protein